MRSSLFAILHVLLSGTLVAMEISNALDSARIAITTHHGQPIELPCQVPADSGPVIWTRPRDHLPVAINYDILQTSLSNDMSVRGNSTLGINFNLFMRKTRFPEYQGEWTCSNSGGVIKAFEVTILVPPALSAPIITPQNMSVINASSLAWTLTCSAHYAHPPVQLKWVKVAGSDAPYDVTPMNKVTSGGQLSASNTKLILTPLHFGSIFSCIAEHPSFSGRPHIVTVQYPFPLSQIQMGSLHSMPSNAMDPVHMEAAGVFSNLNLSFPDRLLVIMLSVFAAVLFLSATCLIRTKSCWELDVRMRVDKLDGRCCQCRGEIIQRLTENFSLYDEMYDRIKDNHADTIKRRESCSDVMAEHYKSERRCCLAVVTLGSLFSFVSTLSLLLAIPVYLKGITLPHFGTDAITSATAGSALWLDCSRMTVPPSSVVIVKWRKNADEFFSQYLVDNQSVGHFPNNSVGHALGFRVIPIQLGQIAVYPVLPGESGVYSCEVALMEDNQGKTKIVRHTTTVIVLAGPITNWALVILIGIALGSVLILIFIGCCRSFKWTWPSEKSVSRSSFNDVIYRHADPDIDKKKAKDDQESLGSSLLTSRKSHLENDLSHDHPQSDYLTPT